MAVNKTKPTYRVHILHICDTADPKKNPWMFMVYGMRGLVDFRVPVFSYLITGENIPPMLVDTGIIEDNLKIFDRIGVGPATQTSEQTFDAQLAKFGYKKEDIKVILHTHLHIDHAGNDHLFPEAKIIMARKELMFAVSGLMLIQYPPEYITYFVEQLHVPGRIRLIDHDAEIAPGIYLELHEGHTWGSMNIKVNTKEGLANICGDIIYNELKQCIDHDINPHVAAHSGHVIETFGDNITGNYWNLWTATAEVQRVMRESDIILPTHDVMVLKKYGEERSFTIG